MEELYTELLLRAPIEIENIFILGLSALLGFIFSFLILKGIKVLFKERVAASLFVKNLRSSVQIFFSVLALNIGLTFTNYTGVFAIRLHKVFYIVLIIAIANVLICVTGFIKEILYLKFDVNTKNNLAERKARTQIDFLQSISTIIIILVASSIALMTITRVRELGTSILASAGIAGIIIGLAAQKSIANLLAGFQIAFTQPIRIDDVVIVEKEWGRIEEITLTYVVVRIWDLRRLIIPISDFIEKPFQNWTRVNSDILGTVFIYCDYSVPLDLLRLELKKILETDGKAYWDGKVNLIQVTEASDRGVDLRVLISAADAGSAWDLRCIVREKLITYINTSFPGSLPKTRVICENVI
ncbi:small-conductance mechanosensitive channel [Sporocytophaga myxococcoides]|uniref:Small-conductance mechanosensitive channel n=1 Tax=Sporocytophaga myxococcoides TaxID=153721 RepID=A0A098LEP5_9BACT|nr:mechanosensitive ion channel domain-containing protein [Sporocytophaga myxococcoides]GAL84889.1 small-conductance mechanosensitive channel [Sporocytophaga myxococcoides]